MKGLNLAFLMDPIASINIHTDTTFALMLEAQQRGHRCYYLEMGDLTLQGGRAWGHLRPVTVARVEGQHFQLGEKVRHPLARMDAVFMRKDPPFDMDYICATYILEHADTWVINNPVSLRNANEKLYTVHFAELMPPTLVSRECAQIRAFLDKEGEIVVKPLYGRGGEGVFYLHGKDRNVNSILEMMTGTGRHYIMAQKFLPEVREGDKRIILVNGEPIPGGLLRIPADDDFRANLVAGGTPQASLLSAQELDICARIGPRLREDGLLFAGIDVINGYLTEINVTSPTGVQQIQQFFNINACARLLEIIEEKLR